MITLDKVNPSNLYEFLTLRDYERGTIRVDSTIESEDASDWIKELDAMVEDGKKNILLDISSEGGEVYGSLSLYDRIKHYQKSNIFFTAFVSGIAASAAAMIILQAADWRQASPNARFLLHEARSFSFSHDAASNMEDKLKEMKALEETVTMIVASRTGRSKEEVKAAKERKDFWMSTQEALEWGLIDEILE